MSAPLAPTPPRRAVRLPASLAALVVLGTLASAQEILVSGFNSGVHRYDFATGAFLGLVGNVNDPLGIVHGPDGHVYVAEEATDKVLRFDGTTLAYLDDFVADDPLTPGVDENGPLDGPTGVLFGEDGHLYVASFENDRILRYDGSTGAYLGEFVTAGAGTLNGPDAGMTFGPDGHLYVPSFWNNRVLKFDRESGASMGVFIAAGSGGLNRPRTVVFRSDGSVLVTSQSSNQILHYDAQGSFLKAFISPNYNSTTGLAISPFDGNVYAASLNVGNVRRFNGTNGTWEGVAVNVGSGNLDGPVFIAFHPDPNLRLGRFAPGTTNNVNQIRVAGATPFELEVWTFGAAPTSLSLPGCPHLYVGIAGPLLRFKLSNGAGTSTIAGTVADDLLGVTLRVQVLEPATCRVTNLVVQTFEQG